MNRAGDVFVDMLAAAVAAKLADMVGKVRLFSIADAAEYLAVTEDDVRRLPIPYVLVSDERRYDRRELDQFIESLPKEITEEVSGQ